MQLCYETGYLAGHLTIVFAGKWHESDSLFCSFKPLQRASAYVVNSH